MSRTTSLYLLRGVISSTYLNISAFGNFFLNTHSDKMNGQVHGHLCNLRHILPKLPPEKEVVAFQ